MRVLHFGKFAHHEVGGIERYVETLTTGLSASGLDVHAVVYDPQRHGGPAVCDGVHLYHARCWGRLASLPLAPSAFTLSHKIARDQPFDIVHLHFPDPLAHLAATTLSTNAKLVVSWHSDIVRQRLFGAAYRSIASMGLRPIDAIIGATPAHLETLQINSDVPPSARYVIPYGIDISKLLPTEAILARSFELKIAWGIKPVVFALGRHVYYKGFDILIRAMRSVDALLVLGGDGPLRSQHQTLARELGLENRIRFTGEIPESELAAYFYACDIFCMPSTSVAEAFGIAQAEAMACAKPIVNCKLGTGVNYVSPHGDTGLTVPPGNESALADGLRRLLEDPKLAVELGERGRARVNEKFSITAMVSGTMAVYERLLQPTQLAP